MDFCGASEQCHKLLLKSLTRYGLSLHQFSLKLDHAPKGLKLLPKWFGGLVCLG
jgi:hypothetical protein